MAKRAAISHALSPLVKQYKREIELLHWRGYLPQYKTLRKALTLIDKPTLDQAMKEFEMLTGLKSEPDEMEYRFCALPDMAPLRARICQWPMLDVTWHVSGKLGSIGASDVKASYHLACSWWNEVCAIRLRYSPNGKTANIVARAANLGGPGGVLADSGLPCSVKPRQIPQRYDGEAWVISESPREGRIDLTRVQCHEIGHAIGCDHISSGSLMAPTYSLKIRKPQAGDVSEMQGRYPGPGASTPPLPGDEPTHPVVSPKTPVASPAKPAGAAAVRTVRISGGAQIASAGPDQIVIVTTGNVTIDPA